MRWAIGLLLILGCACQVTAQRYGDSSPLPFAQPGSGLPLGNSSPPVPAESSPPLPTSNQFQAEQPHQPAYQTQTNSTASQSRYSPTRLMSGFLRTPTNSRLPGNPIKLDTVVSAGQSRAEQTQLIYAYWDLCSSTSDYYLGLGEAQELGRLRSQAGSGSAPLNEAVGEWRTRIETARLAANAAQRRLASLMGGSSLPLPGDAPLCSAYKTRYAEIFSSRGSQEARVLDQLIPLRYSELTEAALAVQRSEQFAASVKSREPSGEGMVRALELLALNRRAFVQIAKDYNRQITRYTELATPGRLATGRLVAMLVERPRSGNVSASSKPLTFRPGLQ